MRYSEGGGHSRYLEWVGNAVFERQRENTLLEEGGEIRQLKGGGGGGGGAVLGGRVNYALQGGEAEKYGS